MLSKNTNNISISLSEEILKIAQVKGSGHSAKIINVISKDLAGISESDLPDIIRESLSSFNAKGSNFSFIASPEIITTKNIEIPSVNPEEIKSIVNLQAGRHTPFSREEIQIGFINIGVYKENYSKILLVIANKEILKSQLDTLHKAGIKIDRVLFAPEGESIYYSKGLDLNKKDGAVAIIDIGKKSTDFLIVFKDNVITSRNIPVGKNRLISEGKKAQDELLEEISKSVESYQSEDIEKLPVEYLISADDEYVKGLQPLFEGKFGVPVKISPYIDCIKAKSNFLKTIATDFCDTSFLDVIAPLVYLKDSKINLIPEEVLLQRSIENQAKEVYKMTVLGFIVFIFIAATFGLKIYFNNAYLTKIKNNYKENREKVEDLEALSNRAKIVQSYLADRMIALDVLKELYDNIPNEIYLTSILIDEEGNVNVQGISDIPSLVFNMGSSLKKSELFKSVEITSTTAKKDRNKDVSAFEIAIQLKNSKKDSKSNDKINIQSEE